MAHINIDPECIDDFSAVANACGITPSSVAGGMIQLWLRTGQWSEALTEDELRSFFDGADVSAALELVGLIERAGGGWKPNHAKGHFVREGGEA